MTQPTTRRGILSAMALAPVVIATPTAASLTLASTTAWDAAFKRWHRSSSAWLALPAGTDAQTDHAFSERESVDWQALIHMPAPNNKALHWKMEQLFGDDGAGGHWSKEIMRAIVADTKRLAQMEG